MIWPKVNMGNASWSICADWKNEVPDSGMAPGPKNLRKIRYKKLTCHVCGKSGLSKEP